MVKRSSRAIRENSANHCGCQRNTALPPHDAPAGARWVPLSRDKFALVDEADYEYLSQFKWTAFPGNKYKQDFYAANLNLGKMHRLIMGASPEQEVDHRDGNTLNNRRGNLRFCTSQQNCQNKKRRSDSRWRFKGVHFRRGKWEANIQAGADRRYLGGFNTEEEAAQAYDAAAVEMFGEFARPNFK